MPEISLSELLTKFGTDEQHTQFFNISPVIYNILNLIHNRNLDTVFSQLKKNPKPIIIFLNER